jgi:hypothetical protein
MNESNYRERLEKAWADFKNGRDCISVQEFADFQSPIPKDGDTWGGWQYDAKVRVLTYISEDYEIDLEQCTTSAETLDRIFQIAGKVWGTPQVLGDLVQAIQDLLRPQATLCSFGVDRKFNARAHLKELAAKRSERKPS